MKNVYTVFKSLFLSLIVVCILNSCLGGLQADQKETVSKPNIIFIMADDLGYHDLGSYSQTNILTPNIDKLAAEGLKFTNVYAGSTVCAPSRSVLITGKHTGNTTVRGNFSKVDGLVEGNRVPLFDHDTTVAEVLKQAGYVTGITGKWGLGEPGSTGVPTRQGFDEWFGYLNQQHAHSYYPEYLWKNEEKQVLEGNVNGDRNTYSHHLFTEFALDFIDKHADTTFFLYLPYTVPHAKYEIPDTQPYTDKPWPENAKVHAAMITLLDRDVGKIMEKLKAKGIDNNTIVFFCSDNGAALKWDGIFDSSGILRGKKRDMYEGGLRTPMIGWMPGVVPQGKVSDRPWYFADVLPTLAQIAQTNSPADIDGISVWPTLLGQDQNTADRFMYWEFHERGYQQAARWNHWKAVKLAPDQEIELYDLSVDPGELFNVAQLNPDMVKKMVTYLKSARSHSDFWPIKFE
ncbi:arylsulfatase [Aquiflexum sp.]|uniref:arylsulfatase n=1 Tax=Aquiflexum sp. TaxID=1872584 RepID=UPI0035941260